MAVLKPMILAKPRTVNFCAVRTLWASFTVIISTHYLSVNQSWIKKSFLNDIPDNQSGRYGTQAKFHRKINTFLSQICHQTKRMHFHTRDAHAKLNFDVARSIIPTSVYCMAFDFNRNVNKIPRIESDTFQTPVDLCDFNGTKWNRSLWLFLHHFETFDMMNGKIRHIYIFSHKTESTLVF